MNEHLLAAHARGRRTILLVDEAQNLSVGVLEQLRLLTNLETAKQKLLQIILIAQPELREKLAQESMRQLAQRVTGRYHLEPLSADETSRYIDHRLRVAGALTEIFEPAAKREVFRLSGGVPRIINVICDRALLGAYSKEMRTVNKRLVRKAASEVSGQRVRPGFLKWLVPALGIALAGSVLWSRLGTDVDAPAARDASRPRIEAAAPARPAAEPSAAANADIDALFADYDDATGYSALLALWGVRFDAGSGNACTQAEAAGLRCLFQRGTWSNVRQLDRPVILTLTGADGSGHEMALVGLDKDTAVIATGGDPVTVSIDRLSEFWFGQYMLVWRPPNGVEEAVGPGAQSETVRWLRQSLAELDGSVDPAAENSDFFDAELEQRVVAFQRQHRLDADGLAGQKTQIIINSLLAQDGVPRLSANN